MNQFVLAGLLASLLLAGCSSDSGDVSGDAEVSEVSMHGGQFDPRTLDMATGETLRFVNHDAMKHTAQTTDMRFSTGDVAADGEHDFPNMPAGTHAFKCKYHSSMSVTVTVS